MRNLSYFARSAAVRLVRAQKERPLDGEVDQLRKGIAARGVHLFNERFHELRIDAPRLDEHLLALLYAHGIVDEYVRKFVQPRIAHTNTSPALRQFCLIFNNIILRRKKIESECAQFFKLYCFLAAIGVQ